MVGSQTLPDVKQSDAYYDELDIGALALYVYNSFKFRDQAEEIFNSAIQKMIRERYDLTLEQLDDAGTDHIARLARAAIDTSGKMLTDIIEEKFIPTLQNHISICFARALALQKLELKTDTTAPTRPVHLLQLDDILSHLSQHANELDTTGQTIRKLDTAKLEAATELRSIVNDMELSAAESVTGESGPMEVLQGKIADFDTKLATFSQYTNTVRASIRALLHKNFNTPDTDWDKEPKSLKTLKLDVKLAGKADPKLVEDLIVSIRTVLHGAVSRFWAIIPFFEIMDIDRESTDFWDFPCEANDYLGVPKPLRKRYISQSRLLFMHMWSSSTGSTQVGSTILRKTYGRKFLGDAIGEGDSVKSSQNDGMASLYFLVATHEYAGYEERSRLRSTLHTTHTLFSAGNPQSKLPAIRQVLDKAMSLKVKIDYNATVKPIVSILRKRSPNFNELATKYLGSESVKYYSEGWEENGLHIFDTLLSEIDHVIDVLGMTGVLELNDAKSKAMAVDGHNAFSYYASSPSDDNTKHSDSGDHGGGGNGPKPEGGYACNKKCAVKDCENSISGETRDAVNKYRIDKLKQLKSQGKTPSFIPKLCKSCTDKLTQGHVQSLQGQQQGMKFIAYDIQGRKRVTVERKQSSNAARETGNKSKRGKQNQDVGDENQVPTTAKVDTSASDVTTLVRSAILDMFVPQIDSDANAPAPVNDPEKVRMDDFRAQMARLGIGQSK